MKDMYLFLKGDRTVEGEIGGFCQDIHEGQSLGGGKEKKLERIKEIIGDSTGEFTKGRNRT